MRPKGLTNEVIQNHLNELGEEERTVLAGHYLEKKKVADLATELGVSEMRVNDLLKVGAEKCLALEDMPDAPKDAPPEEAPMSRSTRPYAYRNSGK